MGADANPIVPHSVLMNLDDITLIDDLERTTGGIPETICCRYNPGGVFTLGGSGENIQVMVI